MFIPQMSTFRKDTREWKRMGAQYWRREGRSEQRELPGEALGQAPPSLLAPAPTLYPSEHVLLHSTQTFTHGLVGEAVLVEPYTGAWEPISASASPAKP